MPVDLRRLQVTHDPTNEIALTPSQFIRDQAWDITEAVQALLDLLRDAVVEAITGSLGGLGQLAQFFVNLDDFLGLDFNDPNFDIGAAVIKFITDRLLPSGLLDFLSQSQLAQALDDLTQQIVHAITGANGPLTDLSSWLQTNIIDKITNVDLSGAVGQIVQAITGAAGGLPELTAWIQLHVTDAIAGLNTNLTSTINDIVKAITGSDGTLLNLATWLQNNVYGELTTLATNIDKVLADVVKAITGGVGNAQDLAAWITTNVTNANSALNGLIQQSTAALDGLLKRQTNLLDDPDCTRQKLWIPGGGFTPTITTDQFRSAPSSLQLTITNPTGYPYMALTRGVNGEQINLNVSPGEIYYVEGWVRAKAGNPATPNVALQFTCTDSNGVTTGVQTNVGSVPATSTGWTKISGYFKIPAGLNRLMILFTVSKDPGLSTFYVDDILLREVTATQSIIDSIYQAVMGGVTTGNALDTVKTNIASIFTTAGTAAANAQTALTNAAKGIADAAAALGVGTLAKSIAAATLGQGANLATNPGFEDTNFYLGNASYSTDHARTGTRSAKIVGTGINYPGAHVVSNDKSLLSVKVRPGDVLAFSAWVYGDPANKQTSGGENGIRLAGDCKTATGGVAGTFGIFQTASTALNGTWTQISGLFNIYNADSDSINLYIQVSPSVQAGEIYYFDDVTIYRVTESQNIINAIFTALGGTGAGGLPTLPMLGTALTGLKDQATTAAANASTALTNAAKGIADAAAALGVGNLANSLAHTALGRGANLITNPGFENTDLFMRPVAGGGYSTAQKRSGTRSFKTVGYHWTELFSDDKAGFRQSCTAGDRFYLEAWVYGDPANAGTPTAGIYLQVQFFDAAVGGTQVGIVTPPAHDAVFWAHQLASLNGKWSKMSGYVTAPAGATNFQVTLISGEPTHTYYWDDIGCYRVTEFQNLLDTIFAALGGTGTGTLPTLTTSLTGLTTQLSTAAANAQTAITNAAQALGVGNVAQSIANFSIGSGANLCPNPSWESTAFALKGNSGNVMSTDQKRSGTRSLRLTSTGTSGQYTYAITDSTNFVNIPCKAGDVFYVSMWVYGKSTNVQTSGGENGIAFCSDPTTLSGSPYISPQYVYATASTALNGKWTEVSGYITMPANTEQATFYVSLTAKCAANEVYYIDDLKVYRVTEFQNIINTLFAALGGSGAGTLPTLGTALTGLGTQVTTAAANATTAITNAANALGLSTIVKSLLGSRLTAGDNLASDPSYENSSFALPGGVSKSMAYSKEQHRTGAQSLKIVMNGAAYASARLFRDEAVERYIPVNGGDMYYCEAWVYGHASNVDTAGNIWLQTSSYDSAGAGTGNTTAGNLVAGTVLNGKWMKLSGYLTIPANSVLSTFYVIFHNTIPDNNAYYVDDVVVTRYTDTQNVIDTIIKAFGGTGVGTLGSLTTSLTGVATQLSTAAANAATAITNAAQALGVGNLAQSIANTALGRGANLATNPGFENDKLFISANAKLAYSTEQKRSGTRSVRMEGYAFTQFFSDSTAFTYQPCEPGDRFYAEVWVYGHANNVDTPHDIYLQSGFRDAAGAWLAGGTNNFTGWKDAGDQIKGKWTKLSGYFTAPAGATSFTITGVQLGNIADPPTPTGNIYYWDDFVCYRVTEFQNLLDTIFNALGGTGTGTLPTLTTSLTGLNTQLTTAAANAQTALTNAAKGIADAASALSSALLAQSSFKTFVTGGQNIVTNPGYENTLLYPGNPANASYTTDQALNGSRSLKIVGTGALAYPPLVADATGGYTVNCHQGQTYYYEFWIRGDSANTITSGTTELISLGLWFYDKAGTYVASSRNTTQVNGNSVGKDNWVLMSGTLSVPANPNIVRMQPLLYVNTAVTAGNVYYIDDVVLREQTATQQFIDTIYQALTGGTAVGSLGLLKPLVSTLNSTANTAKANADKAISDAAALILKLFGGATMGNSILESMIPTLTLSKIPMLPQTQITNLAADLAARLATSNFNTFLNNVFGTTTVTGTTTIAQNKITGLPAQLTTLANDIAARLTAANFNTFLTNVFGTTNVTGATTIAQEKITGLVDALKNAASQIITQVLPGWLPQVPFSSLTAVNPNLLWNPGFTDTISIDTTNTDFVHDPTVGRTTPGSAKVVFNGTDRRPMWSNSIPAAAGDKLTITGRISWNGVTATGGNALEMHIVAFNAADAVVAETVIAKGGVTGTQATWQELTGVYTVPANTSYVAMGWKARSFATAGTGWVDDCEVVKSSSWSTDLMAKLQNLDLSGLFDASKLSNLLNIPFIDGTRILGFEGDMNKMFKDQLAAIAALLQGGDPTDVLLPGLSVASQGLASIFDRLLANTNAIRALQTPVTGGAINVNFANYQEGALPAGEFDISYVGAGTGTVGNSGGAVKFTSGNNADRMARGRYIPEKATGDNVSLRATLKDLPQTGEGSNGTPRIWGIARMSADWLNFVFIRGYATGFLSYKCDIGCHVNGVEHVFQSGVALDWNTSITLNFGVGGNPRRYQGFSGSKLIIDYTEPSAISVLPSTQPTPANFRNIGMILEAFRGTRALRSPGSLAGFSSVNT